MKVQVYAEGYPRAFAAGDCYMTCELNASGTKETESVMRKLGWRRAKPWEPTDWGFQTTFRRITSRHAIGKKS